MLREFTNLRGKLNKLGKNTKKVEHKVEITIVTALTAALAFVIALSWNETIRAFTNSLLEQLGVTGFGVPYRLIESLVITLICVIGTDLRYEKSSSLLANYKISV